MRTTLVLALLLAIVLFAAVFFGVRTECLATLETLKTWEIAPPEPPKLESLDLRRARQIYPYSIVPGGTYDAGEVANTVRHDAVARQHYQGIDIERLHPVTLSKPMMAYVSYRKGDDVNWTDHPIHIAANEVVLTDGVNMVRARCGNRIVLEKPKPLPSTVVPEDPPPPDIVFESPLPGLNPPMITPPATPPVQIAENKPPIEAKPPVEPPPNWRPPVVPCCDNTPPSEVPEPGTLVLVGAGALALSRKLWKK